MKRSSAQGLFFLGVVASREKERGKRGLFLGMVMEVMCQRKRSKGPQARQLVLMGNGGGARRKKGPEILALNDTLSCGREGGGREHVGRERSRARRRSGRRSG